MHRKHIRLPAGPGPTGPSQPQGQDGGSLSLPSSIRVLAAICTNCLRNKASRPVRGFCRVGWSSAARDQARLMTKMIFKNSFCYLSHSRRGAEWSRAEGRPTGRPINFGSAPLQEWGRENDFKKINTLVIGIFNLIFSWEPVTLTSKCQDLLFSTEVKLPCGYTNAIKRYVGNS